MRIVILVTIFFLYAANALAVQCAHKGWKEIAVDYKSILLIKIVESSASSAKAEVIEKYKGEAGKRIDIEFSKNLKLYEGGTPALQLGNSYLVFTNQYKDDKILVILCTPFLDPDQHADLMKWLRSGKLKNSK